MTFKNKINPEFKISKENSFEKIIDYNNKGIDAFMNYIPKECL